MPDTTKLWKHWEAAIQELASAKDELAKAHARFPEADIRHLLNEIKARAAAYRKRVASAE